MPGEATELEKARVLFGLKSWIRQAIRAGTPKYRIVLALQQQGLKLETA